MCLAVSGFPVHQSKVMSCAKVTSGTPVLAPDPGVHAALPHCVRYSPGATERVENYLFKWLPLELFLPSCLMSPEWKLFLVPTLASLYLSGQPWRQPLPYPTLHPSAPADKLVQTGHHTPKASSVDLKTGFYLIDLFSERSLLCLPNSSPSDF